MPNPTTQWCAVLVDAGGKVIGATQYFASRNEARDGSKDMLRMAAGTGMSVAIFKQDARMDMTVDFQVTVL